MPSIYRYKEKLVRCFGMNRLKEKNINDKIDLSYYENILKNVDDLVLKELVRILNNGLCNGLIDYADENNVKLELNMYNNLWISIKTKNNYICNFTILENEDKTKAKAYSGKCSK